MGLGEICCLDVGGVGFRFGDGLGDGVGSVGDDHGDGLSVLGIGGGAGDRERPVVGGDVEQRGGVHRDQIGRASCRERVESSGVAVSLKKKNIDLRGVGLVA